MDLSDQLLRTRFSDIATRLDTWSVLEPGRHTLTLRVENESGVAESSVSVTVVRHGEPPGRGKKA